MNRITVVGSLNIDTTLQVNSFPLPGETVKALNKSSTAGGKGANQAVAAARSGAKVYFIGKVGDDQQGKFLIEALKEEKIDVSSIKLEKRIGTGTANIILDKNGQNSIVVYGGANGHLDSLDINQEENKIINSDFIIAQFETPQKATKEVFKLAHKYGKKTILNPAPANRIDTELLGLTDIIIPNEFESSEITGIKVKDFKSMQENSRKFHNFGVKATIITLGNKGVFYSFNDEEKVVPAEKVSVIDTTAAGDTFIGAFGAKLNLTMNNFTSAIDYAQKASALTIQRLGAQVSIPTLLEIKNKFKENFK
ncbi:ribokinase [Liquorilactobacillus vini]|uniref:Ribokinase n=1 Tax=Liquorilactobacillus vini DSM 20605 TaxID=1133569 RepID=A0A0R2BXI3_9LACO|nr:ribokinase [Liquorilactobacillus vini]KRM83879.1 ribokinase [Liquorilactobacillus vini DSM 20605]